MFPEENTLLQPPSPATAMRMRDKLSQDPDTIRQHVQHLKEWLAKQPHLPAVDDDLFLENFLYGCKNRLPRCKEVLDMYYTVRAAVPEFFKDRDATSESLKSTHKIMNMALLPRFTPEGYRIVVLSLCDVDPALFDAELSVKRAFMCIDSRLRKEGCHGDVHVYDVSGITWTHLTKYTPSLVKKLLVCLQDALPIRIKGVHFVNAPVFMDKFVAFLKPFFKAKLRNRIYVHTKGMEALHELYPPEIFSKEHGGKAPSVQEISDAWFKILQNERDWFISEEQKMADESKRLGKVLDSGELFGMDGSFRKLAID